MAIAVATSKMGLPAADPTDQSALFWLLEKDQISN
jgi:hypothetical protein